MRILLIGLVVFALGAGCSEDIEVADLEGQWRFVHHYNMEMKTATSAPVDLTKSITLNFVPDGISGSISGHTLSHPVTGHYVLSTQSKISITTAACDEAPEDDISQLVRTGLQQADSYKVSNVSLNLYFRNSKEVLIFVRL